MCDFSESKVLHIFSLSLCLWCVLGKHEWVDIYKRCGARQDLRRGCFLMSACRLGSAVENLHSWNCLFLYWTVNCSAAHTPRSMCQSHVHALLSFSPLYSANGAPHEKSELQSDVPPAEGVNPAGLHPAGVWEDCERAGHKYELCWCHRRYSLC